MIDMKIPTGALVMVGDGRSARFLRNKGTPNHPKLVLERTFEIDNPSTHEQGSDRPGRYLGADGANRSAVEQTDWHQLGEDRFAAGIAEELHRMTHARELDELVVIAPPRMLGQLRAAFHRDVAQRVIAEAAKDLAARSVPELAKWLS